MRVALRLFAQGSFALKKLRSLPFGESFGWTAYPPMASGRYSTADSNETKTLCEKILNLLGGYDGELVWSRLKIGADGSDGIDFDELHKIPFRKEGFTLCWGQNITARYSTSNSRETIVLFEKVLKLLEKKQHDGAI